MDSPIIAIGKVEATRQDNSYGGYQWSYRASCPFLSAISRQVQAGGLSLALWLDEKVLKERHLLRHAPKTREGTK